MPKPDAGEVKIDQKLELPGGETLFVVREPELKSIAFMVAGSAVYVSPGIDPESEAALEAALAESYPHAGIKASGGRLTV